MSHWIIHKNKINKKNKNKEKMENTKTPQPEVEKGKIRHQMIRLIIR